VALAVVLGPGSVATAAEPREAIPRGVDPTTADRGLIVGAVLDVASHTPLPGVEVTLECPCLAEPGVVRSDDRGLYRFADLGPGHYTVTARVPDASLAKTFELFPGARYRAMLRMDPRTPSHRHIFVRNPPIKAPSEPALWRIEPQRDPARVIAPILVGTGAAMLALAGGLGTHYALALRDGVAQGRTFGELRHPRDAMIASFAVPGAIGVGALIAGIYGAVRGQRLRRRTGPCAPLLGRSFVGVALAGRF
jgi:hypothetical protein